MEDDVQSGPFAVWQMFNAPIMTLFNNIENAAEGLERLLMSILKLSGDFSEVLVPRPGTSVYPDEYYKSFSNWLIGRLFYVWSEKNLSRIHTPSKDAQTKILNILRINEVSFYLKLHSEYMELLLELIDYYENNACSSQQKCMLLKHFISEQIKVPNIQLNLEPIFVNVANIETCKQLIELTLQLLAETIPMNTLNIDSGHKQYELLFKRILYMLQNYDPSLKLHTIIFFKSLITNYDKVAISRFCIKFPQTVNDLMNYIEVMITTIETYHEKCEVDKLYSAHLFNSTLVSLFVAIEYHNIAECNQILINIATVVLKANHKLFSKELKDYFLKLSKSLKLPENVIAIQNMSYAEIHTITDYYAEKIITCLKSLEGSERKLLLKQNKCYKEVMSLILSSCNISSENLGTDNFLLNYHIERCSAALKIFQFVHVSWVKNCKDYKSNIILISKEDEVTIFDAVMKIIKMHRHTVTNSAENVFLILDIILSIVMINNSGMELEPFILQTTCLQSTPHFSQQIMEYSDWLKLAVLEYLLLEKILLKNCSTDLNNTISMIFNSLLQVKSVTSYKQIIPLSPLLLINKILFPSKLIGDILMPAFLMKHAELQKQLIEILPVIACVSLGHSAIVMTTKNSTLNTGHKIFTNGILELHIVCLKCNNTDRTKITADQFLNKLQTENYVLQVHTINTSTDSTYSGQRDLFAKFLQPKAYVGVEKGSFVNLVECFSNHTVFTYNVASELFNVNNAQEMLKAIRSFSDNIEFDDNIDSSRKEAMFNICINLLVHCTKTSLENNEYNHQTYTLDCIKEFGSSQNTKVLLPSTKLLIYFIMHPQCTLAAKAVVYLRDICEVHAYSPNRVYHRYKKDYCKLFVECSLYNGKEFAQFLLKGVQAFGFIGYRDFISKEVHHFLPYLIPYSVKMSEVPSIIEEVASLVQCTVAEFLIEKFPHVYTHLDLYEEEVVANKCYKLIEQMTNMSILNLVRRHFRVILTEYLLQYCCNPEKVLNACRYLARHDPDVSVPLGSSNMSTSQIADFLQPKFLGVLAYFDHKLVNAKVALSVKRKALQSFPDIMKLMGVKYLTPLRFKVLATLRSAVSLSKEFPKILALAWSAFIHNIDSMVLGPLLSNLAVSLLPQLENAPHEINKIFQYLILSNENLLSAHISELFFLEDSKLSEKVRVVIKRHIKKTQPEGFLDKVKWYLRHLNQDISNVKAYTFACLNKLIKNNRTEIHKAIFGGKNIDPVIVELIECLLTGCKDADGGAACASAACLGQLGALEAGHLPRQYVQRDRAPFAFSIGDECFAATALVELTRAFQYEKDTMNMDCYALTIQEILKVYEISPAGSNKNIWDSFPEHMHQIMQPLLTSRYTLAYPSQPKKAHPLFGSTYAANYFEWAHNWAGQLIPLIEQENIRELLRTAVHPSMRRDVRTLFLFLPYVVLHAVMSRGNAQYIQEEILAVIGLESFDNENKVSFERNKYKILLHTRLTPTISSIQTEESNQSKCCKMIYMLLDFLNRWLLEWCHSKQHPLLNENYKAISLFLEKFDKLTIAKGNFMYGEFERALQYLELYMDESKDQMQNQLPFLAEIYALLDEPDAVAGILSIKRSEPSLKELILAQMVTGRLQDAALCYERLAQEGHLDRHSLQGMIDCYLGLDQPFTAYRLLDEHEIEADSMMEAAAEPLWRLGRFEELEELVRKPVPPSRENWGLLMGRILLSLRGGERETFEMSCRDGMSRLLAQMEGEGKSENALRSGYQSVFGLHIITEAGHVEDALHRLKGMDDGDRECKRILSQLLEEWRRRVAIVQSDVRTVEPLLRCRRILLQQTQELLESTHPMTAERLKACIGDLWLQSAKYARKAGIFQQAYMYILNAEEYKPEELFIEKAKMYWARSQQEQAFTTLKRGLDEVYPQIECLNQKQRKICGKAKLLIAKYNDETTNVDVDVNIGYYKEAVDVCKQWEKSLVCLGAYYEKVSPNDNPSDPNLWQRRIQALNSYGKALQYGHKYLYQSMPRMLSIWLDVQVTNSDTNIHAVLTQMTDIIKVYSERLPLYLYLTAFSQIVSRICHPIKQVYLQLKAIIVKLIVAYPQHTLWMMMCVIKSSYPQRLKRCQDVFADPRLKEPRLLKLICDFTQLAEKLIDLCNKPTATTSTMNTTVSSLVRTLPRLLAGNNFSHIMMPFQEFCKIVLPSKAARQERLDFNIPSEPPVYIAGISEVITILPSLQKPRKVTLKGSDGRPYIIMLKPRDDLRKDCRLMEFNGVVNRFLQDAADTRRRRLYIRTYCVLPLNEECGLIEWVPRLLGLRPILTHLYKQKGIHTTNRELRELMCSNKDPLEKKRQIFENHLLKRHPAIFQEWFRRVFSDPYGWYQARSAYIRTTAVISMVGYILGLGDRHGENILFDSTNGDSVHVDFNCLFNKGEEFDWPERVPFRLTHNMEAAMGPLRHEGMFRKSCEAVMRALREQVAALMSVIGPFVYDPLVSWGHARQADVAERTNAQALQHLLHIRHRLHGMVRTKNKQLSLSLSPEGQVEHLIVEATSIDNLCQMYIGWGPFL